jgi:hypothetical protein
MILKMFRRMDLSGKRKLAMIDKVASFRGLSGLGVR